MGRGTLSRGRCQGWAPGLIAAHKKVFEGKPDDEKAAAAAKAKAEADQLAYVRHHRVTCPACQSVATVQGETFGLEHVSHDDGEIVVRTAVSPRTFSCPACGLKLEGYAELDAAELGGQYTRRTTYSPQEYYGLIDPETDDISEYVERYLADMADEYDND